MSTPKQKPENTWIKRLMHFFKRDKTSKPKIKGELTSEARDKRAFNISIVIGVLELLSLASYLNANNGKPLELTDQRLTNAIFATTCFLSAWLSRRGKSSLGVSLMLLAVYGLSFITASGVSGGGIVLAAFNVGITLAITSAVMPVGTARRVNALSLVVGGIFILLDVFEPFQRPPDPTPGISTTIVGIFVVIFSAVIVRRFFTYNIRTKLIIAFAAVTVLPLLAIGFYDNLKLSDTLYQSAKETLGQLASQTAFQLDTFIDNQRTFVSVQSQNPSFIEYLSLNKLERAGTKAEIDTKNALVALASQNIKFIDETMILDNTGTIILKTASQQSQDNNQNELFKQIIVQKQVIVSGPLIDQKSSKASLYFTAPVKNQAGVLLGALVVKYNANIIESILESLIASSTPKEILFKVADKNTFIRIGDTDNTKLLYKSYQDYTPTQISALQKQGLLLPGSSKDVLTVEKETIAGLKKLDQSVFFTTTPNDKTVQAKDLNSGVELKNMPWLVFVQQSEAAVLTPLAQQKRTTALIFIVLLLLITLAAFGLSQLLASPILSLAAVAQKIAAGDLSLQSDIESNDEIGALAGAFNEMTRQSRALIDSLEQRSKALATSSEVSRRISTILDQQELVTEVVKQVQSAFGYYHAHIYLLDENTKELVMAGGTGEAGKAMLARGHRIPVGKGLVGRCAQNNVTVLVADVARDPQWLPNPLLPDTKSEVAVPISIAERVLGVLDVQHDEAGTLKQEDVDVLQSIANQVAFAVRNARSYSDVQAKADRESLITSIGQKIQGTITVESAIQVAIREIGRALNGAKTQIVLNENSTADLPENNIVVSPE